MEFVIRKSATLPILKMQIVKDGRDSYEDFMSFIETSTIYFSMQNLDNGAMKINTKFAGFVEKTFDDPNAKPEYYVYYKFSKNATCFYNLNKKFNSIKLRTNRIRQLTSR